MTARKKASLRVQVNGQLVDLSFVRLYILYCADVGSISSRCISEGLTRRGLLVSARSVSQLFRGLQSKGLLRSSEGTREKQRQTVYSATRRGRLVIEQARGTLRFFLDAPG